ncbi:uncharacterized protein LOC111799925 [Cucurbita pepo subsp. pepo]|uniref:uncharacterized protein LOC111799925 n=1 Tax=Cucurbita pepo subsp. pepo TaxID=3664 RepID=UPI000C9D6BEC|nr:uncharacterized protein LOC111799925 [Cucurbita pepo subsp. pepo]
MDIIATPSAQGMRRLWRRRGYQKLGSDTRTTRSRSFRLRRLWRLRRQASKVQLKIMSPLKLLAKFHDTYVEMMMKVANSVGNIYAIGAFGNGKRIPKPRNQVSLATCDGEHVDAKFVLEIYNKLAASKNLANGF